MITNRKTLLFLILSFSFILLLCFSISLKLKLFWTTSWIDSPSHFLGGVLSSLIVCLFLSHYKNFLLLSSKKKVFWIMFFSLIIGIFWEFFELYFGMTHINDSGYISDTLSDLLFDCLGAFVGISYVLKRFIWINN